MVADSTTDTCPDVSSSLPMLSGGYREYQG
jgi:hypothetical protein